MDQEDKNGEQGQKETKGDGDNKMCQSFVLKEADMIQMVIQNPTPFRIRTIRLEDAVNLFYIIQQSLFHHDHATSLFNYSLEQFFIFYPVFYLVRNCPV